MPTKSESARINGAKSRGPKTQAGRLRSSQNALKHGLTSRSIVLPSEDPADYDAHLHAYLAHFQPDGPAELDLVHEMAAAQWRLRRLAQIESQLYTTAFDRENDYSEAPLTSIQALAGAFETLAGGSALPFLQRLESSLTRAYSRALRNLLHLQRLRSNSQPASPTSDPNPICKNEPTAPAAGNSYLNAPQPSTLENSGLPDLLKLHPSTGHLQSGPKGTIWQSCLWKSNNTRMKASSFSISKDA